MWAGRIIESADLRINRAAITNKHCNPNRSSAEGDFPQITAKSTGWVRGLAGPYRAGADTHLQWLTTHSLLQYSSSQSGLVTGGLPQPARTHVPAWSAAAGDTAPVPGLAAGGATSAACWGATAVCCCC